jgi:hypothetical protein
MHKLRPPCSGRAARCCARCRRSRSCTWRACCFLPPQCPKVQLAAAEMVAEACAAPRPRSYRRSCSLSEAFPDSSPERQATSGRHTSMCTELVAAWASAAGRAKHNAAVAQLRRLQLLQVRLGPNTGSLLARAQTQMCVLINILHRHEGMLETGRQVLLVMRQRFSMWPAARADPCDSCCRAAAAFCVFPCT